MNFDVIKEIILYGEPYVVMVQTDKKIKPKRKGRT
jgi:hypothetical protein